MVSEKDLVLGFLVKYSMEYINYRCCNYDLVYS